jgi:Family of unknown function (DUF6491)
MVSARTAMVLSALALLVACASPSRMTTAERLEFYRAHAGEPVRSISVHSRLWGWRAVGDSALTIWTRRDEGFLLELSSRCTDLPFASSIGLSTRTGRVSAGFDSVVVPRRGTASPAMTCRIGTIRPLNTRVVKEPKRELHDVDVVERDPAVPDEPQ